MHFPSGEVEPAPMNFSTCRLLAGATSDREALLHNEGERGAVRAFSGKEGSKDEGSSWVSEYMLVQCTCADFWLLLLLP